MLDIGKTQEFLPQTMTEVLVEGTPLLVVNDGQEYYVTEGLCPHMKGHLAEGSLEGTIVTCPVHGSQFDVKTGRMLRWTTLTGFRLAAAEKLRKPRDLKTYRTQIKDGVLLAEDPED